MKFDPDFQPDITVIIAAYNEEEYLEDCIMSILNSDYPKEKIKILIGSDGSTDRTGEIGKSLSEKYNNISFYRFERGGKNNVLNHLVPLVQTEIVYFFDADLRLKPDALKNSIGYFADDKVGLVMSMVIMTTGDNQLNSGQLGESLYQKYEFFIRNTESQIYSTVNNMGTLYGVRKELLNNIPDKLVCDDMYNLFNVNLKKKRAVFCPESIVHEVRKVSSDNQLKRRIRLVSGGLATVKAVSSLLSPKYGIVSYFLWSHKIFRWLTPIVMIIFLVCSAFINTASYLFYPLIIGQVIIYIFALLGKLLEKTKISFFPAKIFLFYVSMNIGFFLGILRYFSGKQNSIWDSTGLQK